MVLSDQLSYIQAIGYLGVVIGSIAPTTQLYQVFKTKKVRDLNPTFFVLRVLSESLYVAYGILIADYVMVTSAAIPGFMEFIIFIAWCKYHKSQENIEPINQI